MRDMSEKQFRSKMLAYGFKQDHFGYWCLPNTSTYVYAGNGGPRRRDRLAYMIRQAASERKAKR